MAKKQDAPTKSQEKDLHAKLAELRQDLGNAKRSLAANELPNPRTIRENRKEIARTLTAINAERKKGASNA